MNGQTQFTAKWNKMQPRSPQAEGFFAPQARFCDCGIRIAGHATRCGRCRVKREAGLRRAKYAALRAAGFSVRVASGHRP
jgi:hypothetical protein